MKKLIKICIGLLFAMNISIAENFNTYQPEIKSGDNSMGKASIFVNPMGFLLFGPIIQLDVAVAPNFFLNAHTRISRLGLVYQLIVTEAFTNKLTSGMSFGGGATYFFGSSSSNLSKPYMGAAVEYGWGGSIGDIGERYEWEAQHNYYVIMLGGGYRFRYPSKFFMNIGLQAGGWFMLTDEWEYTDKSYTGGDGLGVHQNELVTRPFGMLEISLGWEF